MTVEYKKINKNLGKNVYTKNEFDFKIDMSLFNWFKKQNTG
jgi:hypothetical protein